MLTAILIGALAASAAQIDLLTKEAEERAFSEQYEMTGRYRYVDGDRFFYSCGGTVCVDALVRDDYLQQHAVELNGKIVTIVVRRIDSCEDPQSTQVACVRSTGTAFHIDRWVSPAAGK